MPDALPAASETPARRRRRAPPPGDRQIFFRHWLRNPLGIGAALPSGTKVARGMARELSLDRPGAVLELGGGTGGVTRGILAAGCPVDRLVVVEREPDLAAYLARRTPGLRVVCGDACEVDQLLAKAGIDQLATVVSSLPIKWFPRPAQRAILDGCFARLGPDGAFVQLTNALASPIPAEAFGLRGEEVMRIWAHFLPVQIWRYRREPAKANGRC
ncbi:MAG TPA: methyltransferase domain-containing protein [Stellaceae bacterium]|jgi:phosphatidylethanolamine/phosphatidyl-N-methylethanolamine N-methyltransferase|nr:methyltransferase domain-containing protein [Stellaceae bacterium]